MTHDFSGAVRAVEATLVRDLGLAPLPLPAALARLDGTWRDRPVVLAARAYAGPEVRFARFVEVRGGELEIGNIMVLAAPALALPILGVDLIDVGRDRAVVVADLSPVTADVAERAAQHDVVRARRAGQPALAAGGDLPPWATPWFSPAAVLARVEPADGPTVSATIGAFAAAFTDLATGARCRATRHADVTDQQAAYCAAHRDHDRGLQLLRKIFDPTLADRFLRGVLFPDWLDGARMAS